MKKSSKVIFITTVVIIFLFAFFILFSDDDYEDSKEKTITAEDDGTYNEDDTWAIYWYLCGSDLESMGGAATDDLLEMMDVTDIPSNVKIVIETGGAYEWQNDLMDANYLERYLYDSDGITQLSQEPSANMGDSKTLQDFLEFCRDNYDADHKAVVFWNHGGGSVTGVAFDEVYDYDSLSLNELYSAFKNVYTLDRKNPPFDIVGFDACLMATVDTANAFNGIAKYMVASEETEPGNGWDYSGWIGELADNTGITALELSKSICDSYIEGCELYGTEDEATLSVVDLRKMSDLLTAYDNLGEEALQYAYDNPDFFADLARKAYKSVNYGGNTKTEGYTNMIDLGDFVKRSKKLFPKNGQNVLDAMESCVLYKVSGDYRTEATGLSCYYSFDGDIDNFEQYAKIASSDSFRCFYQYELYGQVDESAYDYLTEDQEQQPQQPVGTLDENEELPLYVDDDGYAVIELDDETMAVASSISFSLAYVDMENDMIMYLGKDNDMECDWENGVFKDNFRGVWGAIDGNLVYMELTEEGADYNIYSVPILLNSEECTLRVCYDFNDDSFTILGARKAIDDESGMSDKNLILLKAGDEITTRFYASTITGDDEMELYDVDTFTVSDDTMFTEEDLGDGKFMMMFELTDVQNNSIYSDAAWFDVTDGQFSVEVN